MIDGCCSRTYYIKINPCVSLTQVRNGVNTERSRDSQAFKERPAGAFDLIHTVRLAGSAASEKLQAGAIAVRKKPCFWMFLFLSAHRPHQINPPDQHHCFLTMCTDGKQDPWAGTYLSVGMCLGWSHSISFPLVSAGRKGSFPRIQWAPSC